MRMIQRFIQLAVILAVALIAATSWGIQSTITYQGKITDTSGNPINDGYATVIFRLWDDPTNQPPSFSPLWEEVHIGVVVDNGIINATLGNPAIGTPVPLPSGSDIGSNNLWLEIEFEGEVMTPRLALSSVGGSLYAEKAGDADTLNGLSSASFLTSSHTAQPNAHHTKTTSFTDLTDQAADAQIPAGIARDAELTWSNLSGIPAGFADNVDNYNAAFDTEAEIDAAVANNGYSTGAHTVDSNAATICRDGSYLNGDGTCDSGDGAGACSAGAVCMGGHTHSAAEITSGTIDIGSGNYTHNNKTGYLYISGNTLIPISLSSEYIKSDYGYVRPYGSSTTFYGYAPIDLPQGATITAVTLYAYDNSSDVTSQNWYCGVHRRDLTSATGSAVIAYNQSINWAPSSNIREVWTAGGTHVVDKANNGYFLKAGVSNTDSSVNFRLYGCRVTYTYNNTNN